MRRHLIAPSEMNFPHISPERPLKRLFLQSLAHVAFGGAACVILVLGWMLYDATVQSRQSTLRVTHTLEKIGAIDDFNDALIQSESMHRGILFSRNKSYVPDREKALAKVAEAIVAVRKLTRDNPHQQRRMVQLEQLLAERVATMEEEGRQRQIRSMDVVGARAAAQLGRQAGARIDDLTAEMEQEALRLLELRRAQEQFGYDRALAVLGAAVVISLAFLLPGYVGFVRQGRARDRVERKLADLAGNLPCAIYQCRSGGPQGDSRKRYEFVSGSVVHLFGISRETLLRSPEALLDSVFADDRAALAAAIEIAARTLSPLSHSFRVRNSRGETRWICDTAAVRKEANGSYVCNGYWADITVQKLLEAELQETGLIADSANRAKSVFLATMSHEIRTPMNGVLGMLELLSVTELSAAQRATLEVIRESGTSLQRIIDDILDFSKIEAGKLEVRPEATSIRAVLEAVRDIYSGIASSKGVALECKYDTHISPALVVDPMRLRQILNNLVSNALKFTDRGQVEIEAQLVAQTDNGDRICFSVRDSGIGISAEDQAKLFQPFVQAASDASPRFGGTGLGLTICQRLAHMMGGTIKLVSASGAGTTVSFELSLARADPHSILAAETVNPQEWLVSTAIQRRAAPLVAVAQAEGTLILIADDHPTNRSLIERQVNLLGYAAESASNGVEALAKWRSGAFSLVITDCNMPEMSGYELARSIRQIESNVASGKRIPIIACTANALESEREICLAAGMDDYLAKPVMLKSLLKALDRWLPIPLAVSPVDRSLLAPLFGDDLAKERAFMAEFRRVNDADAETLTIAAEAGELANLTSAAHRIDGASRMVGATALSGVCQRLEGACREGDWQKIHANMALFQRELARLNAYFEEFACTSAN